MNMSEYHRAKKSVNFAPNVNVPAELEVHFNDLHGQIENTPAGQNLSSFLDFNVLL